MGLEELLLAAAKLQAILVTHRWRFCFIGGIAIQRWSMPRFTQDIDLTLFTGFGNEQQFVDALLENLEPRRPDAREFALSRRVLLARTREGIEVDIALGALPFEERCISRASDWRLQSGVLLKTCSAEDLVVHKAFAGRDLDWGDVERVLIRQHDKLDWDLIRSELKPLFELKGELEAVDKLERIRRTVDRRLKSPP